MYFALRDGPRGFTQDFSCPGLLGIQLPNITYFNYGTFTPSGQPFQIGSSISNIQTTLSHYPGLKTGLGILPVRSPLLGIILIFSSWRLRCFSSRRSLSSRNDRSSTCRVSPIRISPVYARLQLAEAFRSSPRPSSPFGGRASTLCPFCFHHIIYPLCLYSLSRIHSI